MSGPGLSSARLGRIEVALTALVAMIALAVAWFYPVWEGYLDARCPLLALFGIPCITCGGTRAMVALVAGDAIEALAWNPLVALGGLAAIAWLPAATLMLLGLLNRPRIPTVLTTAARRTIIGGFALNWGYLLVWFRG